MRLMRSLIREFSVYPLGRHACSSTPRRMRNRRRLLDRLVPRDGLPDRARRRRAPDMRPPISGCAYFLDVDGTLVDLAATPVGRARCTAPCRGRREPVARVGRRRWRSSLAGPLADLDRLFPGRPLAGGWPARPRAPHGATAALIRHRAPCHRLDRARRVARRVVARHPRLVLEDKGLSLALHYRRSPRLAALRASHDARCAVRARRRVLPAARQARGGAGTGRARTRASAIAAFMREAPFRGRLPIFIGDDVTDEFGFAVVNRLRGAMSIKVGPGPTVAGWRLPNVTRRPLVARARLAVPTRIRHRRGVDRA